MSKTNTTTSSTPATSIELVDPASLLVDLNVRHDPRLDAAFSASIKELGVLVPIVAVRTAEKRLRVRFGHRRTLAAVAAGAASVPVVVAADEATTDAASVERLVRQYAENENRTGLSNAERIGIIEQLSAFGVSSAQIAKRTNATAPTSASLRRELGEQGITVLGADTDATPLHRLTDAESTNLTDTDHAQCPGHAATITRRYGQIDPTTVQPVADELDDEELDDEDFLDGDGEQEGEEPGTVWGECPSARSGATSSSRTKPGAPPNPYGANGCAACSPARPHPREAPLWSPPPSPATPRR